MYFYVKNDKYPELLGVVDQGSIFYSKKYAGYTINNFAFFTTEDINFLRDYCHDKVVGKRPFMCWNSLGGQRLLHDLIGQQKYANLYTSIAQECLNLLCEGFDHSKHCELLYLKKRENTLYITYDTITINRQFITIYYSDLDRNDFYQTPDNVVDFDLFETFLSMNAGRHAITYKLHTTKLSVQSLIDEWFDLQPLFIDDGNGYQKIIKWLKPSQQNKETVETIVNEYRLERL